MKKKDMRDAMRSAMAQHEANNFGFGFLCLQITITSIAIMVETGSWRITLIAWFGLSLSLFYRKAAKILSCIFALIVGISSGIIVFHLTSTLSILSSILVGTIVFLLALSVNLMGVQHAEDLTDESESDSGE